MGEASTQTILIAEGEKTLAQVIAATFGLDEFRTLVVYDGNQALESARRAPPDLLILDGALPYKSGFEVCAALKKHPDTASIPIVILGVKADLASRMAARSAGANLYLTRPFSPTQLLALARTLLEGHTAEVGPHWPRPSNSPGDQWVIYAQELAELSEQARAARREFEDASRQLDNLSKLQSDFLGVITHELMTPFGAIGLALEVLQQHSKNLSADYQQSLDNLAQEIAGLHRMMNGVVKFAELMHKRREPELAHYALDELIPQAVAPVAVIAQARGIDFRCLVPADLPRLLCDRQLLAEAVFQMVHNAVKFNKPGGKAHVRVYESQGWISIEVKDTGVGLTPDRLHLLGQPFEQHADSLRRGREGLGVGWAFVGYVAQVHSGRTHVESPGPGKGSTFTLILPVVPEAG